MDMQALTYFNVNEEDESYGEHSDLDAALAILEDFPNDTVVVCYADSLVAEGLRRGHV